MLWQLVVMLVWLASLGYVRISSHRVFIPQEARSARISKLFADANVAEPTEANMILGMIEITGVAPHDFMELYSSSEQVQMHFWSAILDTVDKEDIQMYFFSMTAPCMLEHPAPLLQISDRKLRGVVSQLEAGQAERLWEQLPEAYRSLHADKDPPTVALRLAPQHAMLCLLKHWPRACVPNVSSPKSQKKGTGSKTLYIDWSLLGIRPATLQRQYEALATSAPLSLDTDTSLQVADALRRCAHLLLSQPSTDDFLLEEHTHIVRLTAFMTDLSEQLDSNYFAKACKDMKNRVSLNDSARKSFKYNIMWLVQVLMMSDCVRDASQLTDLVLQTIRMVLPPVLREGFERAIQEEKAFCLPHKGTISRWRCLLDGAFMIWHRKRNRDEPFLRWMMSDSSTQHGRTFQLMGVLSLAERSARQAVLQANEMINLWFCSCVSATVLADFGLEVRVGCHGSLRRTCFQSFAFRAEHDDFEFLLVGFWHTLKLCQICVTGLKLSLPRRFSDLSDSQAHEIDRAADEFLRTELHYHSYPPIWLGSTGGTLAQKFQAVMHAFFLESGRSVEMMQQSCRDICVSTFDLGTEFSLPRVQPIELSELFPWATMPEPRLNFDCAEANDLDVAADMLNDQAFLEQEQGKVCLTSSLAVSGVLHIIHNAANDLLTVAKVLDEQVNALEEVCALLTNHQTCGHLLERCFSTNVGLQLQGPLKKFSCKVYRARWGSVAFCCQEILNVRSALMWGWSLERYQGDSGDRVSAKLQAVDDALRSDFWWSAIVVLSKLYGLVRSCFSWSEGCPCHSGLDWADVPRQTRLQWETCPLRGLRIPEICAGDFFDTFETLQQQSVVDFMQSLPPSLAAEQRSQLLHDFEKGRAHLFYTFTLKLAAFSVPPLCLCGIAHHNANVARELMTRCLESDAAHPKMQELKSEPLRSEAQLFVEGASLAELENLVLFVAKLKFGFAVERQIEGGHARVFRRGRASSFHTEAFDSLALRFCEIKKEFQRPEFVEEIASIVDTARSPQRLADALGFSSHPALQDVKHAWSKMYRQVIYKADKLTLYRSQPPNITLTKPGKPGGSSCTQAALEHPEPEVSGVEEPFADAVAAYEPGRMLTADAQLVEVMRAAALQDFKSRVEVLEDSEKPSMYVCRMPPRAVATLSGRMQPNRPKPDLPGDLSSSEDRASLLFFSVVAANPWRAKAAYKGGLQNSDMAVSVHECLAVQKPNAFVATTPVSFAQSASTEVDAQKLSLVLTTHLFSLADMQKAMSWAMASEMCFIMRDNLFDEASSKLLAALTSTESGVEVSRGDKLLQKFLQK